MENGYETSEILLDEGTRAKYTFIQYDDQILIIPYWGITEKVASQISGMQHAMVGYSTSTNSALSWDRVIYDVNKTRPKKYLIMVYN